MPFAAEWGTGNRTYCAGFDPKKRLGSSNCNPGCDAGDFAVQTVVCGRNGVERVFCPEYLPGGTESSGYCFW